VISLYAITFWSLPLSITICNKNMATHKCKQTSTNSPNGQKWHKCTYNWART